MITFIIYYFVITMFAIGADIEDSKTEGRFWKDLWFTILFAWVLVPIMLGVDYAERNNKHKGLQ